MKNQSAIWLFTESSRIEFYQEFSEAPASITLIDKPNQLWVIESIWSGYPNAVFKAFRVLDNKRELWTEGVVGQQCRILGPPTGDLIISSDKSLTILARVEHISSNGARYSSLGPQPSTRR